MADTRATSELVIADEHGNPHEHVVSFYDVDSDLVSDVARFVADGLAHGERVVVVATAAHRAGIDEVLVQYGTDAMRARALGRYITLDAAETLATFMGDESPQPEKFFDRIGSVLDAAGEGGCSVRVFGEMVAELWQQGNVPAAIQLEALWNEMAQRRRLSLLCAYPMLSFDGAALADTNQVCELHSKVEPPRSYEVTEQPERSDAAGTTSQRFVPVPSAVPAARRFAVDVLRSWGEDAVVTDASLVVSELATNAVSHASSAFQVSLTRTDSTILISVEDVGATRPQRRQASPDDFGGRGMLLVEALARSWGCDTTDDGKSVWAELGTR